MKTEETRNQKKAHTQARDVQEETHSQLPGTHLGAAALATQGPQVNPGSGHCPRDNDKGRALKLVVRHSTRGLLSEQPVTVLPAGGRGALEVTHLTQLKHHPVSPPPVLASPTTCSSNPTSGSVPRTPEISISKRCCTPMSSQLTHNSQDVETTQCL